MGQAAGKKRISFGRRVSWKVWLLMGMLTLLVAATYTWFSLSQTPYVSDMDLFVGSASGLELALSADAADEDWGQSLDFSQLLSGSAGLRPVTYLSAEDCFYAASYGVDGRIAGITTRLSDEENALGGQDMYYIKLTFYARSAQPVAVTLSPAVVLADGQSGSGTYVYGTPVWSETTLSHTSGAQGAEYAVRIGLRITPVDSDDTASGASTFFIYEPNCDGHLSGTAGYVETLSIDGGSLIDADHLIRQTTSSWSESSPVQRTVVVPSLGELLDETTLFTLDADGMARIELYIWLEGQDTDCTNQIGQANNLTAAIQFAADTENQSGLVDVE
ncbi:MAG: hypothetical protein LUD69_08310 [Oscillospiraceae bacterium]|nr:hypothetical protein [Oscillospiraceae bacterium]